MACNFAGAIARVWRICSELGIRNRKHAMLWIFQVFALSAGLYGCQVWATKTLTFISSATTKAHIHHISFLKMLLGVKRSTKTHCAPTSTPSPSWPRGCASKSSAACQPARRPSASPASQCGPASPPTGLSSASGWESSNTHPNLGCNQPHPG